MNEIKSGTISILGKPNTGKSTLINALTGRKISAVSEKPNTTRNKILGVLNTSKCQILFLDTPGIQKSNKFVNRIMVQSSFQAITESDITMILVDGSKAITNNDYEAISRAKDKKLLVVINKIDLIKKGKILKIVDSLKSKFPFIEHFIPISALNKDGLDILIDEITNLLPNSGRILPDDYFTDQPEKFYLSEIIREKIHIPSVPYSGFLDGDIGYIKLSRFTKNCAQEVESAIEDLNLSSSIFSTPVSICVSNTILAKLSEPE